MLNVSPFVDGQKPTSSLEHKIGVEWHDDVAFAVPIEFPRLEDLDAADDRIRELHARGKSAEELLREREEAAYESGRTDGMRAGLAEVYGAPEPKLRAAILLILIGSSAVDETTPELAASFGLTKQALQQAVDRAAAEFRINRKARWMRPAESRERMSQRNYRKAKSS